MSEPKRRLPRVVVLLGWISLLADIGSEMAYPVLPLYLVGALAAPKAVVGLIEGLAQLVVSLVTAWAGYQSDRGHRILFVRLGYSFPFAGRLLVVLAGGWPLVLAGRLVDRLGKGLRTSPRDALLADAVHGDDRGRAFGFHRMMDNAGAVIGVAAAIAILAIGALLVGHDDAGADGMLLWWVLVGSAIASLGAAGLTLFLGDRGGGAAPTSRSTSDPLPSAYWRGLAVLVLFALANSSDAFLLLRGSELLLRPWQVALAYAGFCLVQAAVSMPLGKLSDRIGRWPVIGGGIALYAATYAGLALSDSVGAWAVFLALYGISTAATDGVKRALVADHVPSGRRGEGLGIMHATTGIAALLASLAAGILWDRFGAAHAFWLGAGFATLALLAILTLPRQAARQP